MVMNKCILKIEHNKINVFESKAFYKKSFGRRRKTTQLDFAAALHGAQEGDLVRIFEGGANRDAVGKAGHL